MVFSNVENILYPDFVKRTTYNAWFEAADSTTTSVRCWVVTVEINPEVPRPGDFEWTVFAMCDSYAGGLN